MKTIELIVPCYNEEQCISPFYEAVKRVFNTMSGYEFLITYVDDGSSDNTLKEIKKMASLAGSKVQFLSLSRNFGKEAAMAAGFSNARGDYVAVLDVDLQHPPELIPQMLAAIEKEGYDCATARRVSRKGEGRIRNFLSTGFYHVFNRVTSIQLSPGQTDYRLMKRMVVDAIMSLDERDRFTKGIYSWVGFKNKWIEYENVERTQGISKWNLRKLFTYSYHSFLAFATTPLRAVIWLGFMIVFMDVIWVLKILIDYLRTGVAIGNGITTLMILVMFFGGLIVTILGMIGEYLARIYLEVKKRPVYIIREDSRKEETGLDVEASEEQTDKNSKRSHGLGKGV